METADIADRRIDCGARTDWLVGRQLSFHALLAAELCLSVKRTHVASVAFRRGQRAGYVSWRLAQRRTRKNHTDRHHADAGLLLPGFLARIRTDAGRYGPIQAECAEC